MTSEAPRRLVLTTRMPIRWGDMDALQHVNNTVYFRYMEQARIEWMHALGHGVDLSEQGPVIATASCRFLRPMTYPGEVEVRMFLGGAGRSSIETFYELRQDGAEPISADGAAKLVWISTRTGKSIPLPESLRASAAE